jgi:hypothetical protein
VCGGSLVTHHSRKEPMSRAELEARAIQRAKDEHVHIRRTARPGVSYTLVSRDGVEACSCKSYAYRGGCKHVEALRISPHLPRLRPRACRVQHR